MSRAWKWDKQTKRWNPCEVQDDLAAAMYMDQRISTGDPLQADYSMRSDGIYYCGERAYAFDNREKK